MARGGAIDLRGLTESESEPDSPPHVVTDQSSRKKRRLPTRQRPVAASDILNVPDVRSPHPALQLEVVVAEICRWLGPLELSRLLRTAKLFKAAAQRELWRAHGTLEALLLALPNSIIGRKDHPDRIVRPFRFFCSIKSGS